MTTEHTQPAESKTECESIQCIVCGSSEGIMRRGLCQTHYFRFRKRLSEIPSERRGEFEEQLIRDGLLLPVGKRHVKGDVFEEAARKFLRKKPDSGTPPTDADIMEQAGIPPKQRRQRKQSKE